MYSSKDILHHRWHALLSAIAFVVSFAVVCQAHASSFSARVSSGEPLPCVYRGIPYFHGESWKVDECTSCNCDDAISICVIESCWPVFCVAPVKPEGKCCFLCPYNVMVKQVLPEITSTNTIAEEEDNSVSLNVPIKFQENPGTSGVSGADLWILSAWASSTPDGRGARYGYTKNVLDDTQMDQYYKKQEIFQFTSIDFEFNDPMAECEDMKYICVRIDRGDNPITTVSLNYEFSGYPDESVLTGCTRSPECIASSFSARVSSGEPLLPCVYQGIPYLHGEPWKVDECTSCNCDNAISTCVIESCGPAFCVEPVQPEGECCFLCPYNVKVKQVLPEITSTNTIAEGGDNSVSLNVPIKFQEDQGTSGVSGADLWILSAWASSTPDGSGARYGYTRNVLDVTQMDQYYKKEEIFQFAPIDFEFNDPMAECEDMKYICVRIDRGDNPITKGNLGYQFSGYPDEGVFTGCTGSPECR